MAATGATALPGNLKVIPYGVRVLQRLQRPSWISRIAVYRIYIFLLTYLLYVTYHIVRKPLGVVKNVLRQTNCSGMLPPPHLSEWALHNTSWCAWEPFQHKDTSSSMLSVLDFTYRFCYSIGLFFAGHTAERVDVRKYVSIAMVIAGLWVIFAGLAYFWSIHAFSYFVLAQVLCGLSQAAGWPSMVTLMGNWFGKKRRGLIFGIWNTDTSVGNIFGALIAGIWVSDAWGYSFIVPGLIIGVSGLFAYFLVVVRPEDVGLPSPDHEDEPTPRAAVIHHNNSTDVILGQYPSQVEMDLEEESYIPVEKKPISFWRAVLIPGVIEYSFCLFFCKAVYYAFFFWLPVYIKDATTLGNEAAADLSTAFDGGGIIGGILAGLMSDVTGGSASVCGVMFILAIPSIYCMEKYVAQGTAILTGLLLVIGFFLNGPYTLITTAVSTELGTRPSLVKETHALPTVVAVIDAMGSLGSAFGPLIAGLVSSYGWKNVFYYLMVMQAAAVLCLTRLIYREIRVWLQKWRNRE